MGKLINYLSLEEVLVVVDGIAVGQRAHLVLEHLLVDAKVGIAIKVVVARGHLLDGRRRSARIFNDRHRWCLCPIDCVHVVVLHCVLKGEDE